MLVTEIVLLVILLVCSAFFSASETALFSLNHVQVHRLKKTWHATGDLIEHILEAPTNLLSTILIGNTFVNMAAAAIAYVIAETIYPGRGVMISIPAITILLLFLGEVTPKRLAMLRPERLAVIFAPILIVLILVMTPVRVLVEAFAKLFKGDFRTRGGLLSADEFLTVVKVGEEEGILGKEERTMVDGIIGLGEMTASDVMTPRVDLVAINLDDPLEKRIKAIEGAQFRHVPVYRGSVDRAEGFLDVPMFLLSKDRNFDAAIIPPFFVPETAPLDTTLSSLQKEGKRIALVNDEFGGTAGLLTMGDILEEIIGVESERGIEKLTIQKMSENRWIADGSMSLEDINYELGTRLDAWGVDRISGWLGVHLMHIPRTGEVVEAQGCKVMVHRTRKNRVVTVFIEKIAEPGAG